MRTDFYSALYIGLPVAHFGWLKHMDKQNGRVEDFVIYAFRSELALNKKMFPTQLLHCQSLS